jgi:uncharacterized protein (DUF1684 family)
MMRLIMPTMRLAVALMIVAAWACGGRDGRETTAPPASTAAPTSAPTPAPPLTAEQWRVKHEADYRRDWVSIAGLHALKPGANSAGSAAGNDIVLPASTPPTLGRFVLNGRGVRFEPATGAPVRLKDQPVTAPIDLKDDSAAGADELLVGDVRLVIHVSGDHRSLRVRDPNGPLAREFRGFTWFPIQDEYRVVGRFIKDAQPRRVKVLNTVGDIDEYATEGVVEFTLRGQTLRLRPFTTRPKRFYIVFRDASSGQETYETARFLYADLLDDGTTVLDFNIAYNPPCAFNPYTTCPIPLSENTLPIKILAGEKAYPVHVTRPRSGI